MIMSATEAITSRRSIRAFTDQPVDDETIRAILRDASRAASGTNIQPWHVVVLQGQALTDVIDAVQAAFDAGETQTDGKVLSERVC